MTVLFLLIEAFMFPCFLAKIYNIENKKFVFISGILQFIVLYTNTYLFRSEYLTAFLIVLINIIFLKKQVLGNRLDLYLIPIGYYVCIMLSELVVLFFIQLPSIVALINKLEYNIQILIYDTTKLIILLVMTVYLINNNKISSIILDEKKWKHIYMSEGLILVLIIILGKFVLVNPVTYKFLYLVILGVVILNVLFIVNVLKVNQLSKENLNLIVHQQNQMFNDEKLKLIKSVKNEIDAIDHRLFYVIFKIDQLLEDNETEKIKNIIDKYKSIVTKHNMIIDTSNPVFDCLLSLKINDLLMSNVIVKSCIFISENEIYDNLSFINFLTRILEHFSNSQEIQLYMNEEPGYLVVKIIWRQCDKVKELEESISKEIERFNGQYKLNENNSELKMIISK